MLYVIPDICRLVTHSFVVCETASCLRLALLGCFRTGSSILRLLVSFPEFLTADRTTCPWSPQLREILNVELVAKRICTSKEISRGGSANQSERGNDLATIFLPTSATLRSMMHPSHHLSIVPSSVHSRYSPLPSSEPREQFHSWKSLICIRRSWFPRRSASAADRHILKLF